MQVMKRRYRLLPSRAVLASLIIHAIILALILISIRRHQLATEHTLVRPTSTYAKATADKQGSVGLRHMPRTTAPVISPKMTDSLSRRSETLHESPIKERTKEEPSSPQAVTDAASQAPRQDTDMPAMAKTHTVSETPAPTKQSIKKKITASEPSRLHPAINEKAIPADALSSEADTPNKQDVALLHRRHAWHRSNPSAHHQSTAEAQSTASQVSVATLLNYDHTYEAINLGASTTGTPTEQLQTQLNAEFNTDALQQYKSAIAYSICFSLNRDKIHARPSELPPLVNVHIVIARDGTLHGLRLEPTQRYDENYRRFYDYVEQAIQRAAPFKPLPAQVRGPELIISFYIDTNDHLHTRSAGPITFYLRNPQDRL